MKWYLFIIAAFCYSCNTPKPLARTAPINRDYTPAEMTQMLNVLMLTTGSNDRKIAALESNVVTLSKEQWQVIDGVVSMKPRQTFDTVIIKGWIYIGTRADSIINLKDTVPSFERKQPTQ